MTSAATCDYSIGYDQAKLQHNNKDGKSPIQFNMLWVWVSTKR